MTVRLPWPRQVTRVLLAAAVLAFLFFVRSVLVLFLVAFFLAYLMEPLVLSLQRRGAPRSLAIITLFVIAALLAAFSIGILLPALSGDLQRAARDLPRYLLLLEDLNLRLTRFYHRLHLPLNMRDAVDRLAGQAGVYLERLIGGAVTTLLRIIPSSLTYLIVPIIAYYISRDYTHAARALYIWLRRRSRPDLLRKVLAVDRVLRAYFSALALDLAITTSLLTAGLALLGLDLSLLLGVLAGMLNIIPYFGPLLGALPAVALALIRSPWRALAVVILFILVNQFEAAFLMPRFVGGRIGLHPLLVIFALLAGGKLFGFLGLILAVPVTAALKVLAGEFVRSLVQPEPGLTSPGASDMMEGTKPDPNKF